MKKIIILLAMITIASCSSTKTKQVTKTDLVTKTQIDSVATATATIAKKEVENIINKDVIYNQSIDADVQKGDTLKVAQYNDVGKLIGFTVFSGKGKASVKKESTQKNTSTTIAKNTTTKVANNVNVKKVATIKMQNKATVLQKEKSISPFSWFWLIILIAVVLYIYSKRF